MITTRMDDTGAVTPAKRRGNGNKRASAHLPHWRLAWRARNPMRCVFISV